MDKKVLCTCIWCLQDSDNQGKLVSRSTHARHLSKQKKTWPDSTDMPVQQRHLVTPISLAVASTLSSSSAIPTMPLLYNSQDGNNQKYVESNNFESHKNAMKEIFDENSESKYEYDNEKDSKNYNDEYNYEYNGKDNEEYSEKCNEEYSEEYNEDIDKEFDSEYVNFENLFKGLQLFQIKNKYNISEAAFNKILKTLEISGVTLYRLQKLLGNIVPFKLTLVDCCINSCVAFTGELVDKDHCPEYKTQAEVLHYRHTYTSTQEYLGGNQIGDIFDGLYYKSLVSSGFFFDHRNIALIASTDGYQIFRQKRDNCWIILLINANLPPDI
ncbi:18592_t:CDS:2, partial [Gigaspora margarita]